MKKIFILIFIVFSLNSFSQIRISQVYGGGGNPLATYTQDFVELFNAGTSSVDISGWSVQYASATGTSWAIAVIPAATTISPGKYFLVGLAVGGAVGIALPATDATGTMNMSGTAGKVALVNNNVALSGATACSGATVVDVVGYGATASCAETAVAATTGIDNTKSLFRGSNGCTETNNNSADFTIGTVNPRNSSTAASPCTTGPLLSTAPNTINITGYVGTVVPVAQSFNLSGTNLTGFPGNITVTASANLQVSLSSGSGFATSVNVPYSSATLASTAIYVRTASTATQGLLNGTVTCSGAGAASTVVTVAASVYQNYYNTKVFNGLLNNVSTWSTQEDGSGPSPVNFTSGYQLFNIISNNTINYAGVWDVTGAGNSRIVAKIDFTILPGVDSLTSATKIDVGNNAKLTIQNNRIPFLNNLEDNSTVIFSQMGTTSADTIRIPAISYYHLNLYYGLKYFSGGTTTVRGDLTTFQVVSMNGSAPNFSTINALGHVNFSDNSHFEPLPSGDAARITLAMNGNIGNQILGTNSMDTVALFRLQRDSVSTNSTIAFGGGHLILGNSSGGGLRLNEGSSTTTTLFFSNISFVGASVATPASTGKLISFGGTVEIKKTAGTSNAGTLRFMPGVIIFSFDVSFGAGFNRDSILIATDVQIGHLILNKGKIIMSPGTLLTMTDPGGDAGLTTGGSTTSFVEGKIRKVGFNSSIPGSTIFPVGKGNKYAPVEVDVFNLDHTVEYFPVGYGTYTIDPTTLSTYPNYNVSQHEYWIIDRGAIPAASTNLTFYYTDAGSGILNPAQVKVAHFDGTDWNDLGGTAGGANTTANGSVTVTGVTTFSPFTFAARATGVIPVKLNSFVVQKINNSVKISWTTEQEINTDHFTVQRSFNGRDWMDIATINAAGNSNLPLHYSTLDNNPTKGINYYRLKQVDKNAKTDYSETRSVLFNTAYQVLITPNPASGIINVYVSKNNNSITSVYLYHANGKLVQKYSTSESSLQINAAAFSTGLYFIKVMNDDNVVTEKIILK